MYDWLEEFVLKNNNGEGYTIPNTTSHTHLNKLDFGGDVRLIKHSENDSDVAVYEDVEKYIIVGNVYGPWAVNLYK